MSRLFSRQSINLSRVIWIAIKKYVPDRFKRLMFNECKQRTKHTVNKLNILGFQGTSRPSSFSFVNIFFFVNPIHCKTKITKSSWFYEKSFLNLEIFWWWNSGMLKLFANHKRLYYINSNLINSNFLVPISLQPDSVNL